MFCLLSFCHYSVFLGMLSAPRHPATGHYTIIYHLWPTLSLSQRFNTWASSRKRGCMRPSSGMREGKTDASSTLEQTRLPSQQQAHYMQAPALPASPAVYPVPVRHSHLSCKMVTYPSHLVWENAKQQTQYETSYIVPSIQKYTVNASHD